MDCKACQKPMVKLMINGEYFCGQCTKCPRCGRRGTIIDANYGVMPCKFCRRKEIKINRRRHWLSDQSLKEYAATPFWRHMGLKAKPEELAQEKYMKYRGWTYADLQSMRNEGKNAHFNSSKIINQILEGKMPDAHPTPNYRRERSTGD